MGDEDLVLVLGGELDAIVYEELSCDLWVYEGLAHLPRVDLLAHLRLDRRERRAVQEAARDVFEEDCSLHQPQVGEPVARAALRELGTARGQLQREQHLVGGDRGRSGRDQEEIGGDQASCSASSIWWKVVEGSWKAVEGSRPAAARAAPDSARA